jgi:hypothetical protein
MLGIVTAICNVLLSKFQTGIYDNELMETLQYDDSDVKATPRSSANEITAHLSKRKNLIF